MTGFDVDLPSTLLNSLWEPEDRFSLVWIRYDEAGDKMQVAVHRVEPDVCPSRQLLSTEKAAPAGLKTEPSADL